MSDELVRLRTDVVLSCINAQPPPFNEYLSELNGSNITKQDMAALSMMAEESPYSMRNLSSPLSPSQMVLPEEYQKYLAGHTKLSTTYLNDWPMANQDNRFGEHHPFGMKSNSCPLLHGASWGEPLFVDHLFDFISHLGDEKDIQKAGGETLAHRHKDGERHNRLSPDEAIIYGNPDESILDLYIKDVNRHPSYEEWQEDKKGQLSKFGLLPYLFGREWNTQDKNETFIDLMKDLAKTESYDSPDSKAIRNNMQNKAGMTWDRALRSWRDRFTPLKAWWMRPSDRHGPSSSPQDVDPTSHLIHPFIDGVGSHNHHWWEPFQHWGGVGRDSKSLHSILDQSYPEIFNKGWLSSFLTDGVEIDSPEMLSGSHFPELAKEKPELSDVHTPKSIGDVDYERRRASWSHASNHQHLHPSQIGGQGARMSIPTNAFSITPFGRSMQGVTDLGAARGGILRENHPNSNPTWHDLHNAHYNDTDKTLRMKMMQMATGLREQHGNSLFAPPTADNQSANTIARGNIQQLAAAANMSLMRGNDDSGYGDVHPSSKKIAPPIFNSGNTDAWGHNMTSNLAWKWDPRTKDIAFDVKEQPFSLLQRTAHEGLVNGLNVNHHMHPITPKTSEINALSSHSSGMPSLTTDLHKSDDYEQTGIFQSLIEPAHVIRDLDDMGTLKGFSGEWVVQKKPKGKRVMVTKKGKSIDPVSLPSKVKKSLKDTIKGDAIFDAYVDGDLLTVVDLLVHKDTDMAVEPLSDRVNTLRTLYTTTDNVHFPSPNSCVSTDESGLMKTIATLDKTDLLIRDSHSTFIKGKEVHPKWILYPQDEITKSLPLPPLPEMSLKGNQVVLEYPAIFEPVIVKTDMDDKGFFVVDYDGPSHLIKQAKAQFSLWSPVAGLFLKEGAAAGGAAAGGVSTGKGTVTSTDSGTLQPLHSARKRPLKRKSIDKAPEVKTEKDEKSSISTIMRHAKMAIMSADESIKEKRLIGLVDGLTSKKLELYGGEYGLEQTESGEWTVNEAIDDNIAEKFAFPRMNRASADGGAWSGMQADLTAPTGPTEITDEENTTFGDPRVKRRGENEDNMDDMFKPLSMRVTMDDGDAVLEMKEGKAILRYPGKEKNHDANENDVLQATRDDHVI